MGDVGRESASGKSRGGMDISEGMAGGGDGQIWPQRDEFSTYVRGNTIIHCRRIRDPKLSTSRALHVSGYESGVKGFRDDPDGKAECMSGRPM